MSMKPDPTASSDHWLVRPGTIRVLWIVFAVILALTVIADFLVDHHPVFGIEATIGFSAWFGFLACFVLVAASKVLGILLKRSDRYYDGEKP